MQSWPRPCTRTRPSVTTRPASSRATWYARSITNPFSLGRTVVVPRTKVGVQEDGKKLAVVWEGVSLQQLVDGLNALGIGPLDMIAILQAIKAAGAIQADIEVM